MIYGKPIKDAGTLIKQDRSSIGASCKLEMDYNEGYDERDRDKIGSSEIGRLPRSRSKVAINEFK